MSVTIAPKDGMPPQTALELLTEPGLKINSSMKRSAKEAREIHWIDDRQPKNNIDLRMKKISFQRLVTTIHRCEKRLRGCNRKISRIVTDSIREDFIARIINPLIETINAARTELQRRQSKPIVIIDPKLLRKGNRL
jgi:hypothetical protein